MFDGGRAARAARPGCSKRLKEDAVKFYASEVLLALQYLHLQGFVYRWGGGL